MPPMVTARGVIARTPGAPTQIEVFEIDAPEADEVLVRLVASGVCRTDLSARNGVFGDAGFPFLLGHEGCGFVEYIGKNVTNVRPGDFVILAWRAPCGGCRFCHAGKPNLCAASLNAHQGMRTLDGEILTPVLGIGTFCTHTLVHSRQCVQIDPSFPPEQMSLVGCCVATGVGAALYAAHVQPGQSVAVIGCGGVGVSAIMGARLAGATTIVAVDRKPHKLAWASEFGATHTVNLLDGDPVASIKAITGGHGVDVSFEAVGRPETLEVAIFCRDLAGTCVVIGVGDRNARLDLPIADFFDLGGSLRVTWYGDCLPTRDFPLLADWYAQGALNLDRLVTRVVSLEQTENAFRAMERGETLRSVIRL